MTLGLGLLASCTAALLWIFELVPDLVATRAWLREAGPMGGLVFVVAFAGPQPWGLSGSPFVVPAALVWSTVLAVFLANERRVRAALGHSLHEWRPDIEEEKTT
jgi:hypothetical protein